LVVSKDENDGGGGGGRFCCCCCCWGAGRGCSRVVQRRPESSRERRGSHLVKDVDRCNRRVHLDRQPRRDLAHVLRRHRLVNRPLGKVVHHHLDALVRQRLVRRVGRALRPSLRRLLVVARVRLFELAQFVAFHLVRERTRVRGGAHAHTHPHRHPGALPNSGAEEARDRGYWRRRQRRRRRAARARAAPHGRWP